MRIRVALAVSALIAIGGCGPCDDEEYARPAATPSPPAAPAPKHSAQ
jgi:hypothetical protein